MPRADSGRCYVSEEILSFLLGRYAVYRSFVPRVMYSQDSVLRMITVTVLPLLELARESTAERRLVSQSARLARTPNPIAVSYHLLQVCLPPEVYEKRAGATRGS